jgi:RNA polymerase sigma-70 factor (ECF subfamily)
VARAEHAGHAVDESAAAVRQAYQRSGGVRWGVSAGVFAAAVATSVAKRFPGAPPARAAVEGFVASLHAEDLALACACAAGHDGAWDHFVQTFRPQLYRAARAMTDDATGRELADSLYADLFGLGGAGGARRSLLAYYHGRSALSTWLRSVLAQRHVDLVRMRRRTTSLDDPTQQLAEPAAAPVAVEPDQAARMAMAGQAVSEAMAALEPQDRLRLAYYYVHGLTQAEAGRLFGEHEATASRKLERARKALRLGIERSAEALGVRAGEIEDWGAVARDAWDCALADALGVAAPDRPGPQGDAPAAFKGKRTP